MTSQEASTVKLEIFNDVNESVYIDSDSGLWYLTYLRDQNYDWNTIEKSQRIIVEMLRLDNDNKFSEKDGLMNNIIDLISPQKLEKELRINGR